MPSEFDMKVYRATSRIPRGRVATYAAVAAAIGCLSCRAVGQALRRNPYAPRVPCHRVIASDLSLGGFQGKRSGKALELKRQRLEREGVRWIGHHLADERVLYFFPGTEPIYPRKVVGA